ncbi:MAG TPA: hypothetical protein VN628_20530 [Vicinamibacterales bacterium]|nr:hypothetical protein [Vicinamibacterales bacterium]
MNPRLAALATTFTAAALAAASAQKPPASLPMGGKKSVTSFFTTSRGPGRGGNLGGLAGADAHCQALAKKEGSGDHAWRAYLSTMATASAPAVNARDRIGTGPWYNALGDRIAMNLQDLHGGRNAINLENAVTEKGDMVTPEEHDILTGSRADGTAYPGTGDLTCGNWTSSGRGRAQVGHVDRKGGTAADRSWNSAHATRGCSQDDFTSTGSAGLFYCFAVD